MDLDFGVIHGFRRKILRMAGDIDICCSDREFFVSTLKKTIQSQGGILISDSKNFGNGIVITGVFPKNNWECFRFDVYEEPMLTSSISFPKVVYSERRDDFLTNREVSHGIYCVNSEFEFRHYMKRKILKKDFSDDVRQYSLELFNSLENGEKIVLDVLGNMYGSKYMHFLTSGVLAKDIQDDARNYLLKNLESDGKVKTISALHILTRRVVQFFNGRKGTHIAFVAPDGAGKTTVINALLTKSKVFGSIDYFHLRPTLLPAVSARARDQRENEEFLPHSNDAYNFPLNVLKYYAMVFDYFVGYFVKIYTRLFSNNLVVCDRYFYDLIIDPGRFRLRRSKLFLLIFKYFIPKPEVVYALLADPQAVIARKQDLTIEAIIYQNEVIRSLDKEYSNIVFIDANKSPEDVFEDVFRDVIIRHSSKYFSCDHK
jgi:thymidylate kinase